MIILRRTNSTLRCSQPTVTTIQPKQLFFALLWLCQFQAGAIPPPPPPPPPSRAFVGHFTILSSPGWGIYGNWSARGWGIVKGNFIFSILKDVHAKLFILNFLSAPNIKILNRVDKSCLRTGPPPRSWSYWFCHRWKAEKVQLFKPIYM